jgi:Ca2+-binding RTX toxin-like protein
VVAGIFDVQGFGALSEWNGQFSSASAKQTFQKIASLGSNSIELTARIWTQTGTTNSVFADPAKTESDASLLASFQAAHGAGLSVLFKAALSTLNGTRVSSLAPADVAAFFASYKAEIVHLATIAQAGGVEMFAIGNEMSSLSGQHYRGYWTDLIAAVREVYHGELTYAAATDEAAHVSFWDELDTIGVNTYPPLTASRAPTVQELVDAWTSVPVNPYYAAAFDYMSPVDFLHSLATKYDKPLLMTEVGYRSVDGTAIAPGSWTSNGTPDVMEQADAYNAFFQVWSAHGGSWFKGAELWQWDLNNQYSSTGYSVMGKPAEAIVSQYFHGNGFVPGLAASGSSVADIIDLGRGNDIINAGLGDDVIRGGAGDDVIVGGPGGTGRLAVTTVTLVGYGSVVGGIGALAQIMVNGKPVSGLLEFKPAVDPAGYQTFTVSFENPEAINSIDISLANATPGRALHIKDFLINGVAVAPADATNASSPGTFDLYVRNIHVDASSRQDWFLGAPTDNDVIDGGAGNDVITGGAGNDIIEGGDGIDTAKFSGNARDYDISVVNGLMVVRDRIADRDGADHLTHLEFLQFADGVIDAGNLFATLSNNLGSTLQILATDGAGKIIGQLLRHADGSDDLYTFEIAGMPGGELAVKQPVYSADAFESASPDAAGHLPGFQKSFSGGTCDQLIFDNHEHPPIVRAASVTLHPTAFSDILNSAGGDTFTFGETVGHDVARDFKANASGGHVVGEIEAAIAADITHLSAHIVGHDIVVDPGHDASITLTGVTSLTAGHLLFI